MECARALKAITARAGTFGLKPAILENKVAYVDMNDCPAQLDILAHVDVVPAGDGWSVTEPFVPLIKDGKLYGCGTCRSSTICHASGAGVEYPAQVQCSPDSRRR